MIVPVFKDLIKDRLGGSNLMVSYFMSIAMLGSFLFSPVAGYLSDRLGSRRWFIGIFAILDGLLFFAIPSAENLEFLQLIRFFEGVAHIFVIGLLLALIADRENDPENTRFFQKGILLGVGGMLLSLGVGIGSPLGILGKKNPLLPFYVAGGIMIFIGLLALIFLRDYEYHYSKKFSLAAWLKAFHSNPLISIPYLYNFIDRFTVGFFVTSFSLHMREGLGLNPGQVGLLMALVLIPMSLLSYPFARLSGKTGPFALMAIGSILYGGSMGIAGFFQEMRFLVPSLLLAGVGAGVMFVPSMILASKLSPREYNASNMAVFTGAGSIGFMLGPIASVLIERALQENIPGSNFGILSMIFGSLEILIVISTLPFYNKLRKSI